MYPIFCCIASVQFALKKFELPTR